MSTVSALYSQIGDAINDPDQNENVIDEFPLVVRSLKRTYEDFWASLPSAEELLSRHDIGAIGVPETRLNAMDWYKGDSPWHQLHMPKFEGNGKWAIEVVRAGTYRFELRHHPRESPKALQARVAFVQVGGRRSEVRLEERNSHAVIELALQPGKFELETGFIPGELSSRKKTWGALFAYVQKID